MLQAIAHAGLLPLKDVVADGLYGQSPDLLDAVDACVGVTTFVAIPSETRGGRQRPRTEDKTYPYTGDVRAKRGGHPHPRPKLRGGVGGTPACVALVSAHRFRRDHGAHRIVPATA